MSNHEFLMTAGHAAIMNALYECDGVFKSPLALGADEEDLRDLYRVNAIERQQGRIEKWVYRFNSETTRYLVLRASRLGSSHDGRTNRWNVTCPKCSKQFEPFTTMFAAQGLECPKCDADLYVNYRMFGA